MPHFLIEEKDIKSTFIELYDEDILFHLVKVLRIKVGEKVKFIDKSHKVYNCKAVSIEKKKLVAQIESTEISKRVLNCNLSLIQAILAPDAQNLLVANATQTGVKKIYPTITDNVSYKASKDKIIKWQKIVYENFKQCERADMAQIQEIMPLREVLKKFKKENILIFSEKDINTNIDNAIKNIDKEDEIAVVVGPEGGFSDNEFDYFNKENYKLISLGTMIYKAPNAVVAAISNVVSRIENER